MRKTLYEHCLEAGRGDVLRSFDGEKNAPLTARDVSYGSKKMLWWRCEKGHGWRAQVKSRAAGAGCPYCAGKIALPGETDLAATHPELCAQWVSGKNAPLTPRDVSAGSGRRVWWRCEQGHEWQATVLSRSRGAGCPVCAGKAVAAGENDLASRFPDIAAQWHGAKNGALTPQRCTGASNRKVWWLCPAGHEYQAAVSSRTSRGTGCPYCAGRRVLAGFNDLATLEPELAAQWHPTLNGELTASDVTAGSSRRAWWLCGEGHAWQAVIYSRTGPGRCGCPACAGRVKPQRRYRYAAAEQTVPRPGR